ACGPSCAPTARAPPSESSAHWAVAGRPRASRRQRSDTVLPRRWRQRPDHDPGQGSGGAYESVIWCMSYTCGENVMRYNAEHKQQTRDKVLTVAARAIREQGPERVSVAAVMGEAGLTHGGFYAHFASKEALVAASIEHMFEQMSERIDDVTNGKDARTALHDYIDFYLSERHAQARGRGCPIAALGSDLPRLDDATRKAFAD